MKEESVSIERHKILKDGDRAEAKVLEALALGIASS